MEAISSTQKHAVKSHNTSPFSPIVLYPSFEVTVTASHSGQQKVIEVWRGHDTFTPNESGLESFTLRTLSNPKFALKRALKLTVKAEAQSYLISNNDLNVHSLRKTYGEALDEWEQVLIDLYLSYHSTPDDQLKNGGKRFKNRLAATVRAR